MWKFINRDRALEVINRWIRDGSNVESFGSYEDAEWIVLRGADGIREEFHIFHTWDTYHNAKNYDAWEFPEND